MSDQIPPLTGRSKRAKTMLRGADIRRALDCMGVSMGQFARVTGINPVRLGRQLSGSDDGDIPLSYELFLFLFYHHPELRKWTGPIDLPFEEWGIDIEIVDEDEAGL